jgi:plastocyanin
MLFAATAVLAFLSVGLVSAEEHWVEVGGPGKLLYNPEAIAAAPGDVVHFKFLPKNHTVTQSSFAAPCSPLMGDNGAPMFDSGFHFVPDTQTTDFTVVDYVVKDTKPVWMFCAQTGHCGKGMVFAINCGPDGAANSFTNFKNSALAIGAAGSSAPGYPNPNPTTGAPAPTTTPQTSGGGAVHQVKVGGTGLIFDPPTLQGVGVGDRVQFVFQNKNHSATQSTFAAPCNPKEGGFDSGFQFVAANTAADQLPMWELTVQTTEPIWAYCKQGNHCASGMVFAINSVENSDKNFAAFSTIAKNSATGGQAANSKPPGNSGAGTLIASTVFASVGAFMAFFL